VLKRLRGLHSTVFNIGSTEAWTCCTYFSFLPISFRSLEFSIILYFNSSQIKEIGGSSSQPASCNIWSSVIHDYALRKYCIMNNKVHSLSKKRQHDLKRVRIGKSITSRSHKSCLRYHFVVLRRQRLIITPQTFIVNPRLRYLFRLWLRDTAIQV
jgi:hypothetical protein